MLRRKLSTSSWSSARNAVLGRRENASDTTLSGAGPELCISLLQRGLNFSGLEARLGSVDQQWIEEFLAANGLSALIEAVQVQSRKGFSSITDVLRQLECVRCVKSVIRNRCGLEFLVQNSQEELVQRLILGILYSIQSYILVCVTVVVFLYVLPICVQCWTVTTVW